MPGRDAREWQHGQKFYFVEVVGHHQDEQVGHLQNRVGALAASMLSLVQRPDAPKTANLSGNPPAFESCI